jgi:hypothetical protein
MAISTFALDVAAFVEKAKANAETVVRNVTLKLAVGVVEKTAVGNPDVWAINSIAKSYNDEVNEINAALRNIPENVTKNGRLKPGRKLNDGMDIKAPAGYVGGRARANWIFTVDAPSTATIDAVDPTGNTTKGRLEAQIKTSPVGDITYIVNNLPYIERLELGWSKQAPAGMVGVTLAEFQRYVVEAATEVKGRR